MGMNHIINSMVVTKTTQDDLIDRVEEIMQNENWKPEGESYTKPWRLGSGEIITVYRQKLVRPSKKTSEWDWSM